MKGPTGSQGLGPLVPLNFMPLVLGAKSASPNTWSCTHDLRPSRGWVLVGTVGTDEPFAGHKESLAFHSKDHPPNQILQVWGVSSSPDQGQNIWQGLKSTAGERDLPTLMWETLSGSSLVLLWVRHPHRLCAPVGPPWASLSYCSLKCGCWACGPKHLADLAGCWAAPQDCHPPAHHGPSRTSCSGVRGAEMGRKQSP